MLFRSGQYARVKINSLHDVLPEHTPKKLALLQEHCARAGRKIADVQIADSPCVPGQDAMERVIDAYAQALL